MWEHSMRNNWQSTASVQTPAQAWNSKARRFDSTDEIVNYWLLGRGRRMKLEKVIETIRFDII